MSNKSQTDLTGLLGSIEGLAGLFENLLEAELTLNSSAAVQAAAAATSASAAASTAASITSMAATIATETSEVITNAGTVATNTTAASSAATTASSAATTAAAAAATAQAAATAAQTVQTQLNTLYEFTTSGGTVTLTAAQAGAGIIWVQGNLASNLVIVMPATVHPFILDNATTGTYSVTVQMTGGAASCIVGQGNASQLYCDGATGVYSVSSVSGLQFTSVKPVSSLTNVLTNQYQGAYTPMSNATGSTYQTVLPQGATMGVGGAVFLDAISGAWTVLTNGTDTADFGASYAMAVGDKAMFTWNGASWRTTLYSNQASPVFKVSLTVPVAFIARGVFGGVTDDGTTAVQATTGRFTTSLTVPTMPAADNSFNAANTAFVHTLINNLIGGAPGNLDTLNELATAINDDTSFAATVTNLIAAKAAISGQVFTGQVSAPSLVATGGYVSAYGWGSNNQNGMLYLSQNGANYLLWDGTNYNMPNGNLKVNGSTVWTAGNFTPSNYAALAGAVSFGGGVTGTGSNSALKATNGGGTGQTSIMINRLGAATDAKNWELLVDGSGTFVIRAVNDAYTAESDAIRVTRPSGYALGVMQVMSSGGRVTFNGTADDGTTAVQVAGSVRAANYYINSQATGDSGLFGFSNVNGPSITAYGTGTSGAGALVFKMATVEKGRFSPAGNFMLGMTVDDNVNQLQLNGSMGIYGAGNGITFPDGTQQTTGYVTTAPTAISYTPANGVTTFACQNYGVGLVQVYENGVFFTDYTATTGNSITLNNAANGRTQYTVVTGILFQSSNVIQPAVSVVTPGAGVTSITLPVSTLVGYLWIFQGGAWLVPNQDFTFNGGTAVTLTNALTQATDTLTLVMLQPVSFTSTATQSNVQAAQLTFAMDAGAVNAYAVAYIPAVAAPTNGMQLSFFASHTNNGASTLACNGGTAYPIYGNGHSQLTGGEIVSGGFVEVAFSSVLGAWVLLECTGGAQQMAGNLNFVGLGLRITGEMSQNTAGTWGNNLSFQTSTVNGQTSINALPNGTNTGAQLSAFGAASPANAPYITMGINNTTAGIYAGAFGSGTQYPLGLFVNNALRWQITTGGQLLYTGTSAGVGAWGTGIHSINTTANTYRQTIQGYANNQGFGTVYINGSEQSTTANAIVFVNSAGTQVGGVLCSASATAYNTTSDYRLKEEIKPLKGALARVMATRTISYIFKNDDNRYIQDGFLAHELQEHHPRAVTGEKDSMHRWPVLRAGYDPKNIKPKDVLRIEEHLDPQLVDHSKLVPTLWAAVQELKKELDEARAEIAELKKRR